MSSRLRWVLLVAVTVALVTPSIGLEEGIAATYRWFLEHGA